ncbi:low choriolytic enzyme-like [Solea senegalensis]|uniref:Low choriolytic enzyme-like n=1 Tax=Solea senegalensis TaxID=28829 RepID=A0AAV6PM36_SOLSE|nr:hatching enzyme 1.2-like isoform X2 [Solea senegalensis]KAG7471498.1 low choriolytic enzyme-like [Solea senegalensis]
MSSISSSPVREAKTALQEDWLITALKYMESNPETLQELMTKNYAMMEGDVMLSTDRNFVGNAWPTRKIPYVISPELASRTGEILSAMAMLSGDTCLSFHQQTKDQRPSDHLIFTPGKGCASYVGCIGGEQPILISPLCTVGNIAHEILHALGFHHEHTRMDREQYITILSQNIMTGKEINFHEKRGKTFGLPYDITSIMHYGRGFFSANGLPTIVSKEDVKEMGQRDNLTELDVQRVHHLYNCNSTEKETEEESNGAYLNSEEEEQDTNPMIESLKVFLSDQNRISANKTQGSHTPSSIAAPDSLQNLDMAKTETKQ